MGVPNVVYKWKSLRTLYISVFVMNVAGCVIVVIMIVSAVKLRMGVGQYLDLVIPGEANFWPGIMFLIAFLCAPVYAIGVRLCFHLRFYLPDSLPRLNKILFVHCILCFLSMIIVIGINAIGILHVVNFHRINQNGIIESMQEYGTEVMAKVRVDMIQINFHCCGSKSFKDWFHVHWMQREGETPEIKEQNGSSFLSTDVPFSCCATQILRPCVHHNVLKPSEVYLYHPEHRLTIATTGCHVKVINHARYVGGLLILALILLAAYQMVLGLLSRLLQTAHSNTLYIGPRKGRYLAWILGSMPNPDAYHRLVYEGSDVAAEETIPIMNEYRRTATVEEETSDQTCRGSDNLETKSLRKSSEILDGEKPASSTVSSHEEPKKSSTVAEVEKGPSNSGTSSNSIPTPPPSPEPEMNGRLKKSMEEKRSKIDVTEKMRKFSSGLAVPKVTGSQLKELRESLEYLDKYQSPWRGGSPLFQAKKSSGSTSHQSSQVDGWRKIGKSSLEGDLERVSSSSGSSSPYKKDKVCGKDSIEEDEMRIKKFCKDLSTEYNKSPYSKQRRDFSEQYKRPDPIQQSKIRGTDDGRRMRNEVCARFNPADTYSRFRGSLQDTMMRRASQTQPAPPPIPISNQRTVITDARSMSHQMHPENPSFPGRLGRYKQFSKPQGQIGRLCRLQHQKPSWAPPCPPTPTYFPISSRPPGPPRLPPCPYGSSYLPYQQIDKSCGARPFQFTQNESRGSHSLARCQGRRAAGQPPRFSGC